MPKTPAQNIKHSGINIVYFFSLFSILISTGILLTYFIDMKELDIFKTIIIMSIVAFFYISIAHIHTTTLKANIHYINAIKDQYSAD